MFSIRLIFVLFLFTALISCRESKKVAQVKPKKKIVLVYMVADNNLDTYAIEDINEMEEGFRHNDEHKLLVYIDRSLQGRPSHPYLLEITHDTTDRIASSILFSYPEQNSASSQTLKKVLTDVSNYFKDNALILEGLVMWSHGNAWLPNGIDLLSTRKEDKKASESPINPLFKSFGKDNIPKEANMDIKEMANVLNAFRFNYLIFDACFMSSIEVLYELRNTTNYIIASPTEILSSGFPYKEITPLFFNENNTINIAKEYFNSYQQQSGVYQSASVAVIQTSSLEDLANEIKTISKTNTKFSNENIQEFDRQKGGWVYDLKHLLSSTNPTKNISSWDKVILYENHTASIANTLYLKHCGGVSTYIMDNNNQHKKANEYYKTLSWYKASGYDKMFD